LEVIVSRTKRKGKRNKSTAGQRGLEREQHFKDGGSLREWRGTGGVHKNKKDKRQNRKAAKKKAIQESQEE
jgi:hypothetical protein